MPDTSLDDIYRTRFRIRWSDLDGNGHAAHTAYGRYALEGRLEIFERLGLPIDLSSGVSGVILREEVFFRRELVLHDELVVEVRMAGMSRDGSRFRFASELSKFTSVSDGIRAATVITDGAYFSLAERRIIVPYPQTLEAMSAWPRTADFTFIETRPSR